jgi:hypothetical protein
MNRYQTSIPRTGFAAAAIILATLTLSASVAPAKLGFSAQTGDSTRHTTAAPATTEIVGVGHIDVIAVRKPALIPVQGHAATSNRKQQS